MGYLYKGDAVLKGNLSVATDKPLDNRSVVQNSEELLTINSTHAYNGMLVVSIDDKVIYLLLDKNNITSLSAWKKIGTISIDGNEIDLNSFVTIEELNNSISNNKTEILTEVDEKINNALNNFNPGTGEGGSSLTIDDTLTETSSNPVKSSGIYNGIKTMINAKFIVLTEAEYNAMATHDANTFYYIKK